MRYVAFLGGVNVGGHRVTMERLRSEVTALGYTEVSTFIASGNVIFTAPKRADHDQQIAEHLGRQLGWPVPTWVRTAAEVVSAVDLRPYGAIADGDTHMVAFCAADVGHDIERLNGGRDRFTPHGNDLHWLIHGSLMDSAVTLKALAKELGQPCTTRNMKSLAKLADLLR
jgi:uncharacterized protein (DUF1697 family)